MMRIERLFIRDLRIVEEIEMIPVSGINVITGENGAGKTTLLEGIHLLGNGRTFRHAEAPPLIRHGVETALVSSKLVAASGRRIVLGVERGRRQGLVARANGRSVKRRSELLRMLPLQLLTPASHELVEKGPELRRRFLDQGLFHVEQDYYQLSNEYAAALKQRNAALKMADLDLVRSFSGQLAETGERLTAFRAGFVEQIEAQVSRLLPLLGSGRSVSLGLRKGWGGNSLLEALSRNEKTDLKMGFTMAGCHRAEMTMTVDGVQVSRVLSRGEQKLLVYALALGQLQVFADCQAEPPVLLIDDIGAELDGSRMLSVIRCLNDLPSQVFVTTLDPKAFEEVEGKVFHVEQGRL